MLGNLLKHTILEWKDRIYQKITGRLIEKPWMKYREIEIIEELLSVLKPKKCLEWGAGFSTLYFPKLLDSDSIWISIEHEKDWFLRIKKKLEKLNLKNVKIYNIPPNNYPWSDEYGDGDYQDLIDYIEFPSKFGKFDFILVDGRARKHCLIKAYEILSDYGIVVLHDANRKYYHDPFNLYKYQILFMDYRKDDGGLWIGSKKLDISKVFNVQEYKKFWQTINKFGRLLRV